jgi:hypothetical protein
VETKHLLSELKLRSLKNLTFSENGEAVHRRKSFGDAARSFE